MLKGKSVLVFSLVAVMSAGVFAAQLDVELGADVFDKYIWRGQNLGNKPVIQPSATIGKAGYSLNVWGNMPIHDKDVAGRAWNFNEVDYTLDYSGTAGMVNYSGGFIVYTFPRPVIAQPSSPEAHEIYAGVGFDVFLAPEVTIYRGTKASDGFYLNAAVSHSLGLTEDLSLDLGASLAWADNKYNQDYWGTKKQALNDLVLSASIPVTVGGVDIVPSLSYTTLASSRIRSANATQQSGGTFQGTGNDFWVLGVSAAIAF